MDVVAILAVMVVPIVLVVALGKTPLWWLAGTGIGSFATYLLTKLDHHPMGNLMQGAAGVVLLLYAVALLVAAHGRFAAAHPTPRIPRATLV